MNYGAINNFALWVDEYDKRKRLRALGYVESMSDLDAYTAEVFVSIDRHLKEIEAEEMEKKK